MRAVSKRDPCRRAGTHIDYWGQTIWAIVGPLAGPRPPAKFCTTENVAYACGSIPRHPHVPFVIGVKGKQFTICIDCQIVGIAQTGRPQFPTFSFRIGATDPSPRRFEVGSKSARIVLCCHNRIGRPVRWWAIFFAIRHFGRVATDHVECFPIRSQDHPVRTVFTCAIQFPEKAYLIIMIIAIGIGNFVQA